MLAFLQSIKNKSTSPKWPQIFLEVVFLCIVKICIHYIMTWRQKEIGHFSPYVFHSIRMITCRYSLLLICSSICFSVTKGQLLLVEPKRKKWKHKQFTMCQSKSHRISNIYKNIQTRKGITVISTQGKIHLSHFCHFGLVWGKMRIFLSNLNVAVTYAAPAIPP